MKISRNPATVHAPLAAYVHQIEVQEPVRWLVLSGQVGQTQDGELAEDPIRQLELALANIERNLAAAGMDVHNLVKLTFYLVGAMETAKRREVTTAWLHGHEPCMTLLYVAGLATPAHKVEIDAWACCTLETQT
ncbi:MAG: RidA family protein [Caldilineaceae bacterium]